jgi:hypothetical protein
MHSGVLPLHAACVTHCPLLLQSCGALPTQRVLVGEHSTQAPARHAGVVPLHAAWFVHFPLASQL